MEYRGSGVPATWTAMKYISVTDKSRNISKVSGLSFFFIEGNQMTIIMTKAKMVIGQCKTRLSDRKVDSTGSLYRLVLRTG